MRINIPTNTIKTTVEIGKIDIDKLPRKDRRNDKIIDFYKQYNKMLDSIIAESIKDATEMGTTHIPIALFDSYIDIVKGSFENAAKNN